MEASESLGRSSRDRRESGVSAVHDGWPGLIACGGVGVDTGRRLSSRSRESPAYLTVSLLHYLYIVLFLSIESAATTTGQGRGR